MGDLDIMPALSRGNYYTPTTWCIGCGRKRTADGRCANCDAWWSSPLVRVGGPIVLAAAILLALGIRFLKADAEQRSSQVRAAAIARARSTFPPLSPGSSVLAPVRFADSAAAAAGAAAEPAAGGRTGTSSSSGGRGERIVVVRTVSYEEQVRLRRLTAYVDAAIAADDLARALARRGGTERDAAAAAAAAVASEHGESDFRKAPGAAADAAATVAL